MFNFTTRRIDSHRRFLIRLAICIGVAIASPAAFSQEIETDDLKSRLATLEKRIEEERKKQHIPGLAIAVVKDDRIVFARGFGYSNLEAEQSVTPETLFAVGSTTKAFTAALIGMLADDSRMRWDDPVDRHIPQFRLKVETDDDKVTIRDLLCHRTGFTRMSVLFSAGRLTRPEVLERAATAEPYAGFRKKFLYSNVMYMAAGYAAGQASDSDWESLIAARILQPLNMADSSTSIAAVETDRRLATGYLWDEYQQAHRELPMKSLELIGPAGSLNSNVTDMAQWVRFQLGRGEYEGEQLLSPEMHAETWKQQIEMKPGVGYGLGWMLRDWNGNRVVEHGGSIDGYAAQVALLPEHNLGYVLLANVTATPLQQKSIDLVFSVLAGDASGASEALKSDVVTGLPGRYVANFGPFRDKRFTVLMKDGRLSIDVPGQRVYELKAPDVDGKWYFALTKEVAVSFRRVEADKVISLTMYQGGLEFECPREGVEYAPEVPLEDLQPLVGVYRHEESKRNLKVIIINNRLALDDGGILELAPPDDEQKWAVRANRQLAQIRFNRAKNGSIHSLTRFRKGKGVELLRVASDTRDGIPTVDSLITRIRNGYGAEKAADFGHVRLTGTVVFVHQGGRGKVTNLLSGVDRFKSEADLGKLGYMRVAYNGNRGWTDNAFSPFEELSGPRLTQLRFEHPLWLLQNWREVLDHAVIIRSGEFDGEPVYLLKLSARGVPTRTLAVSAKSGLVLTEKTAEIAPGIGQVPVTITYADYRPVNGVMLPFRIVTKTEHTGEIVTQFETATSVDDLRGEDFRLTGPANRQDK